MDALRRSGFAPDVAEEVPPHHHRHQSGGSRPGHLAGAGLDARAAHRKRGLPQVGQRRTAADSADPRVSAPRPFHLGAQLHCGGAGDGDGCCWWYSALAETERCTPREARENARVRHREELLRRRCPPKLEERRAGAIQGFCVAVWIASSQGLLAMTLRVFRQPLRVIASSCEAIQSSKQDWIASAPGARSRHPVARNDVEAAAETPRHVGRNSAAYCAPPA
jgi:hypothetical protein